MLRDTERGISAGICHRCGEELPFSSTFCVVCGARLVFAQLMPDVRHWLQMPIGERQSAYAAARIRTLTDIRNNGDWRIGCINKGSDELTNIAMKVTIKSHRIQRSPLFRGSRDQRLAASAAALIRAIDYDRAYDEHEPVFELVEQKLIKLPGEEFHLVREAASRLLDEFRRRSIDPILIQSLDPKIFESLVAEIFHRYGFSVQRNLRLPCGEIDVLAISSDQLSKRTGYIIECKRYGPTRRVSLAHVSRFYELKRNAGAQFGIPYGMLVTTSDFTGPANKFYGSRWDLDLKNYDSLLSLIRGSPEFGGSVAAGF
jgi:hypothetical protein